MVYGQGLMEKWRQIDWDEVLMSVVTESVSFTLGGVGQTSKRPAEAT